MTSARGVVGTVWSRVLTDWRSLAVDTVVLGAAPLATLVFWMLPLPTREAFTLAFDAPTRVTVLTSHFVHLDTVHYVSNLLGYGLTAGTGYLCFARARGRTTFLSATLVAILLFPAVLSLLGLLVVNTGRGYGLSGIVAGLLGIAVAGIGVYTRRRLPVSGSPSPPLFLGGVAVAAVRLLPPSTTRNGVIVAALIVAGGYLYGISVEPRRTSSDGSIPGMIAGLGVCTIVLLAAFPRGALADDASPYIHFIGYGLGYLTVYITLRVEQALSGGAIRSAP